MEDQAIILTIKYAYRLIWYNISIWYGIFFHMTFPEDEFEAYIMVSSLQFI